MAGESSRELVGKAGQHVLFVDHDGQPQAAGGEVGRSGHITPESEHHISLGTPQQPYGRGHCLNQPRTQ